MTNTFKSLSFFIAIFACIFIVSGFQACQGQQSNSLSGTIALADGWSNKMYIIRPAHFNEIAANYLGEVIDSVTIGKDGSFSLPTPLWLTEETPVILAVQKIGERFPNHLIDERPGEANYMPVVLSPNETIDLTSEQDSFQKSFSTQNQADQNKAVIALRNIRMNAFRQLQEVLANDTHEDDFIIEREAAHHAYTQALRHFADSTSAYYAALVAIRWVSPTGDFERYPEFIHSQCQRWTKEKPDHTFSKELCALADKKDLPVMVGDIIPNFELPMVSGESTPLFQLLGSKLTILDIWASWCAPCRKENRLVLAPLYTAYKDQGLNIIGYALDSGEGPWKSAIEKDGAVWDHASHLQGDQSPFMDALRITTIPANYILDANGKVLAKNLHGEELSEFVSTYLR